MTSRLTRKSLLFIASAVSAVLIIGFSGAGVSLPPGIGHTNQMEVSAYFPDGAGGVLPNSPVTDRGVAIGRVTAVAFTSVGVRLDLSVDDSVKIGLDATATIHASDAPGQSGQFSVDLVSDQTAGPYLGNGSVIPRGRTELAPQQTIAGLLSSIETMSGVTRATT